MGIYNGDYIYGANDVPAPFSGEPTTYNLFDIDPMVSFMTESITEDVDVIETLDATISDSFTDLIPVSDMSDVLRRFIREDLSYNAFAIHDSTYNHQDEIEYEV